MSKTYTERNKRTNSSFRLRILLRRHLRCLFLYTHSACFRGLEFEYCLLVLGEGEGEGVRKWLGFGAGLTKVGV